MDILNYIFRPEFRFLIKITIFSGDLTFNDRERLRIIGGSQADNPSHHWLVHLEGIRCGAVIIGANWVLTTADCCDGHDLKGTSLNFRIKLYLFRIPIWKFLFLAKMSIFVQDFDSWSKFRFFPKCRFLSKISIFGQSVDCWPKCPFVAKISIFIQNFDLR